MQNLIIMVIIVGIYYDIYNDLYNCEDSKAYVAQFKSLHGTIRDSNGAGLKNGVFTSVPHGFALPNL